MDRASEGWRYSSGAPSRWRHRSMIVSSASGNPTAALSLFAAGATSTRPCSRPLTGTRWSVTRTRALRASRGFRETGSAWCRRGSACPPGEGGRLRLASTFGRRRRLCGRRRLHDGGPFRPDVATWNGGRPGLTKAGPWTSAVAARPPRGRPSGPTGGSASSLTSPMSRQRSTGMRSMPTATARGTRDSATTGQSTSISTRIRMGNSNTGVW